MMQRGDIVVYAAQGDYGKPRPAVIAQSDLFNKTHDSITVCPVTSDLSDAILFRIQLLPTLQNGLKHVSQVMVDKITTVKRDKIGKKIGSITKDQIIKLDEAILLWLDLNTARMIT